MVNETGAGLSTKAFVLGRLREKEGVSGERLGRDAGVSRVAVWKAVKALQRAGYPITGDDRGYRLRVAEAGDFLYPWEFGDRESRFYHWESTDSTMNRARDLALRGTAGETVITAETQTAGRGRNGRAWDSSRGGLFFSLLERPGCPLGDYARLVIRVHVALVRALGALCGRGVWLRWPNDVYAGNKKIAGVLTEFHGEGDRIEWLSFGIGVNVNNRPSLGDSVSCAALLGRPLSRREALLKILDFLGELKREDPNPRELRGLWNSAAWGIGRRVRVIDADHGTAAGPGRREHPGSGGIFLGIDPSGRALVQTGAALRGISPAVGSLEFI
jgi:BirA family biotin operon repressor/biotin-[acetyl-CoA-carboxylase] ligase